MPHRAAIQTSLSLARMGTYLRLATYKGDLQSAIDLYKWNAEVSAAFLHPLHICEVVVRNLVSDALTAAHGAGWPWERGFINSLPDSGHFNPRREMLEVTARVRAKRAAAITVGHVVPELKFAFWETILTARFDASLWDKHLIEVLPNVPRVTSYNVIRALMHTHLYDLRRLRNRIAHHEPIISLPLAEHLAKVSQLITMRCRHTNDWLMDSQRVSGLLTKRP